MSKKVRISCFLVFVMFLSFSSSVSAWDLQLEGWVNWYNMRFSQLGHNGFFGPYNTDRGVGTATANLNFWEGEGILDKDLAANKNALWGDFHPFDVVHTRKMPHREDLIVKR